MCRISLSNGQCCWETLINYCSLWFFRGSLILLGGLCKTTVADSKVHSTTSRSDTALTRDELPYSKMHGTGNLIHGL